MQCRYNSVSQADNYLSSQQEAVLTSTYFLALSQALPVLDIETAIWTPETRAPARSPARVRVPNSTPTTTGVNMTKQPGGIISDRDACDKLRLIRHPDCKVCVHSLQNQERMQPIDCVCPSQSPLSHCIQSSLNSESALQ